MLFMMLLGMRLLRMCWIGQGSRVREIYIPSWDLKTVSWNLISTLVNIECRRLGMVQELTMGDAKDGPPNGPPRSRFLGQDLGPRPVARVSGLWYKEDAPGY